VSQKDPVLAGHAGAGGNDSLATGGVSEVVVRRLVLAELLELVKMLRALEVVRAPALLELGRLKVWNC
jgi:hypothetical protein